MIRDITGYSFLSFIFIAIILVSLKVTLGFSTHFLLFLVIPFSISYGLFKLDEYDRLLEAKCLNGKDEPLGSCGCCD